MIENISLPSFFIAALAVLRMPSQLSLSVQPKNGFIQPSGMLCAIIAGETLMMAMTPMVSAVSVRMVNCMTSVMTTLTMPPLMA